MRTLLLCLLMAAAAVHAQDNPLSAFNKIAYRQAKGVLLRSAEKMPEEDYAFKPTPAVRSFGQLIGHVADSQYLFCSVLLEEKNPAPKIEQTRTAKADLIAALKEAFSYCDRAYDGMTDAAAAKTVKLMGFDMPKLSVPMVNVMHTMEHYGNIVTYLRLKNIVPPTSEAPAAPPTKN